MQFNAVSGAVACTPPEYHFEETWETNPGSDETWTEACATANNCNEDWDSGDAPPSPLHGSESYALNLTSVEDHPWGELQNATIGDGAEETVYVAFMARVVESSFNEGASPLVTLRTTGADIVTIGFNVLAGTMYEDAYGPGGNSTGFTWVVNTTYRVKMRYTRGLASSSTFQLWVTTSSSDWGEPYEETGVTEAGYLTNIWLRAYDYFIMYDDLKVSYADIPICDVGA